MEYWHFTANHLHVTDFSLFSWIKRHNLERESCNKPYNWKIAIRWYFTTRKSFFEQTCIPTAIHFHWLTRNQKQHFSFSKCSRDLFFLIHWQNYEQAVDHQKHCSDRNEKKRERGGNDNPWSFKINQILTNARYFKTCSLYKFKIQPSKVLLQSSRVFFHSFGVYIKFSTSSYQVLYSFLFHQFSPLTTFTIEAVVVFLPWKD